MAAVRTLITGATGFIGARLLREGDRALVRAVGNISNAIAGDLLEPASLAVACDDIETVFHCAGYAHAFSSFDPDAHWRVNFEGTRNLVNAAGEAGVKRFIFLSSVKAMAEPGDECVDEDWRGEPVTPYGKAKRAAEEAVLEASAKYGMHVVNLRLAMVYGRGGRGNLERMAQGIHAGWFPPLPETGNRRSLVHVDDVVAAMRLVADRQQANGKAYIIADTRAYSGRDIYDAICAVLALPRPAWHVPENLLRVGGAMGEIIGKLLGKTLPINSEVISRLLGSACYTPALINRDLGWNAQVSLIEGLREMLQYP